MHAARRAAASLGARLTPATKRTVRNPKNFLRVAQPSFDPTGLFEDPLDPLYKDDYVSAAVEQADVEAINEYQIRLRATIPIPSSDKQTLNTQIRSLLTTAGWADEAHDMVVGSSFERGKKLRASWLEFQIRSFIAHGAYDNALRLFSHLVSNGGEPSASLTVQVLRTIHDHQITPPIHTLSHLADVLSRFPESTIPTRTLRCIINVFMARRAQENGHLERVILCWAQNPRYSATMLSEVAGLLIHAANQAGDHRAAMRWYALHRSVVASQKQKQKQKQALKTNDERSGYSIVLDATPYVAMAQELIRRKPRRPWRTVRKMLREVVEDGVTPNTAMFNLVLRTARLSGRSDRIFEFFDLMHSSAESGAVPDAYTFCTVFKAIDDVTRRNLYHTHSLRPEGHDLFRFLLEIHHSQQQRHPKKRAGILTKGTLNLALQYFMNRYQYAHALVVLRTFIAHNIPVSAETKWIIDIAVLRRTTGELRQRLKSGYTWAGPSYRDSGLDDHSLSWAERLAGLHAGEAQLLTDGGVGGPGESEPVQRERWSRLKHTRAYAVREAILNKTMRTLEARRRRRPPKAAPRVVQELWGVTVDASGVSVSPSPSPEDASVQKSSEEELPNAQALLEVVGRCALAAEGLALDADKDMQQEVLRRIIGEAELEMIPQDMWTQLHLNVNGQRIESVRQYS